MRDIIEETGQFLTQLEVNEVSEKLIKLLVDSD